MHPFWALLYGWAGRWLVDLINQISQKRGWAVNKIFSMKSNRWKLVAIMLSTLQNISVLVRFGSPWVIHAAMLSR